MTKEESEVLKSGLHVLNASVDFSDCSRSKEQWKEYAKRMEITMKTFSKIVSSLVIEPKN